MKRLKFKSPAGAVTLTSRIQDFLRRPKQHPPVVPLPTIDEATVSVVVPVKNAGDDLRSLLAMLRRQDGPRGLEIIVVDSGSTDGSLDLARKFGATVIEIAPEEFSHSYARNLGADHARGKYLLFTVQDALPPSESWLREMFAPLVRQGVVAVSCGESPRPDCDLFYRVASWCHHKFLGIENQDRILSLPSRKDDVDLRKSAQLTDTACLIRKDIFAKYRYRGDYAEDLDLGVRLVRDGHRLAILGTTRIIHSHNRPAYYHLRRGYVDNLALLRILPGQTPPAIRPGRLVCQMVDAFLRVDTLARLDLSAIGLPCRHEELARYVEASFDLSQTPERLVALPHPHPLVDDSTVSFLETLSRSSLISQEITPVEENVAIRAVRAFTEAILEYLRTMHDSVDAELLQGFRTALYKTWALQVGGLWAAAYFVSDDREKARLDLLHQQLTLGV